MAILNFPDTTGQPIDGSFTHEANGVLYSWDGYKWTANTEGGGGDANHNDGPTPPTTGDLGDQWYNTDDGRLYTYTADSSGTLVWIDASPDSIAGDGGGSGGGDTYWTRNGTTLEPANAGDDVDLGNIQLNANGTAVFNQNTDAKTVDISLVKTSGEGVGDNGGIALSLSNNGSVADGRTVGLSFRPGTGSGGSPARGWLRYESGSGSHAGEFHFDVRTTTTGVDATALRITSDGDTLCQYWRDNTTSNSTNAFITGQGALRIVSSAARYKTNVRDIGDAYANKALALRPVVFNSLCKSDDPDTDFLGFVAEEVVELFPEIGFYEEDGTVSGIQYDRMSPILVNLIKQQNTRIEALEAEVQALKGGN